MIELWGHYKVNERKGIRSVMFHPGLLEPLFKTFLKFKPPTIRELFVLFWTFALDMISNNFKIFMVNYVSLKRVLLKVSEVH